MATTLATVYAALHALSLAGVTNLAEPPLGNLPSVRMPCKWIDTCTLEDVPLRAKATGGGVTMSLRVVVVTGAPGQDRHANRWSDTITMVDTLRAGIKAMAVPVGGPLSVTYEATPNFDDTGYFAVVATVSALEWRV